MLRRAPSPAYDVNDVFDFLLGLIGVISGVILIVNNIISLVERLTDNTEA